MKKQAGTKCSEKEQHWGRVDTQDLSAVSQFAVVRKLLLESESILQIATAD
jgi:hypothetical protein